jgi:predicted metal-dependent peptidase
MRDIPAFVRQARLRLMLDQPFLASAVAAYPLVMANDASCTTMATDGMRIYVNEDWSSKLETWEIDFVIAHEVLHCLLGHLDRRGDREPRLWNLAIDYATNAMLVASGLQMPNQGLYDYRYSSMSSEAIYDLLFKDDSALEVVELDGTSGLPHGFDLHLDPDNTAGISIVGVESPSVMERKRLREILITEAKHKMSPGQRQAFGQEIESSTQRQIPWQELLSHFVSGLRKSDYSMYPFNRKHLWNDLFLPSLGVPGPQHLAVAIDTSGSMSKEDISKILGEVASLRASADCTTTVIQCDDSIHDVRSFAAFEEIKPKVIIFGRGGTSFCPVFELLEKGISGQEPVDALIYLTDGFGRVPDAAPNFPILWVLTRSGRAPADWGMVLRMAV